MWPAHRHSKAPSRWMPSFLPNRDTLLTAITCWVRSGRISSAGSRSGSPIKGSVLFGQVHCCCQHDDGYIGATLSACVFLRSVLHRVLDDPILIGRYNNSKTKSTEKHVGLISLYHVRPLPLFPYILHISGWDDSGCWGWEGLQSGGELQ